MVKGSKHSAEARAKISAAKMRAAKKGWHHSAETKAKLSAAKKGDKNPSKRSEVRAKMSASNKIAMNRPEVRAKISAAMKGRKFSEEHKAKMSAIANRPDVKNRRTRTTLQAMARNGSLKQTKPEILLEELLNNILPGQYKFVGLGDFILAGKCPDFVNVNGQKKIIEMIGDNAKWYMNHSPEKLAARIALFAEHGYETLIVNASELKDIDLLKQKIHEFSIAA